MATVTVHSGDDIKAIVEARSYGDNVQIDAATYTLGNAVLNCPDGVNLYGADTNSVIITSTADLRDKGCIVRAASNAIHSDFTAQSLLTGQDTFAAAWGAKANATTPQSIPTNAIGRRLRLIATSDCLYFGCASLTPPALSFRLFDSFVRSCWDTSMLINSSGIAGATGPWANAAGQLFGCHSQAIGPNVVGTSQVRGLAIASGHMDMYGGSSLSINGGNLTSALSSTNTNGTLTAYNVALWTEDAAFDADPGNGAQVKDVFGGARVTLVGGCYDATKLSSGVVTQTFAQAAPQGYRGFGLAEWYKALQAGHE